MSTEQVVSAEALSWTAEADAGELLDRYREMLTVRQFEEEIQRLFLQGHIPGTTHLCIGQEAVCAGLGAAMRDDDVLANTYRGHGHALARGVDPYRFAAELLGRVDGLCGGRAGSLNVIDLDRNVIGSFAIIGGTIGAAGGVGLALKGSGRVAVAVFGDGTTNHGYFFEGLNFAKVLELPVVYVCENNGYGEYTPWRAVTAGQDITARARVFDIPAVQVDGMDVRAVHAEVAAALERARTGGGPQFVECITYRFVGHSRSDPALYRPPGELETWKQRDPLTLTRRQLGDLGVGEDEIAAVGTAVQALIADVFERALASAPATPETVEEYAGA